MITKEIQVNGQEYKLVLTDQIISQVNSLKSLYNTAYEDPESFEDVSAEISATIKEIASAADPIVNDSDLDGLIQEVIKVVDNKAAEIEEQLKGKTSKREKNTTKKSSGKNVKKKPKLKK